MTDDTSSVQFADQAMPKGRIHVLEEQLGGATGQAYQVIADMFDHPTAEYVHR